VNDTPENFHEYMRAALGYAMSSLEDDRRIIILGPWNEWTEGCYLLPDKRYGFGKLKAVAETVS
jgi:hypothetical protein